MHVLIIGAAGMVGRKLVSRLATDGVVGGERVSKLTLVDVVAPSGPECFGVTVEILAANLPAPGKAEKLVTERPDTIFHLAAIVSGEAEADFDKG